MLKLTITRLSPQKLDHEIACIVILYWYLIKCSLHKQPFDNIIISKLSYACNSSPIYSVNKRNQPFQDNDGFLNQITSRSSLQLEQNLLFCFQPNGSDPMTVAHKFATMFFFGGGAQIKNSIAREPKIQPTYLKHKFATMIILKENPWDLLYSSTS